MRIEGERENKRREKMLWNDGGRWENGKNKNKIWIVYGLGF